ncbi:hypothetical protein Pla175_32430 [Pirellulimonas nuda]|uniref:Uncharacterized protein n=1 Tax=Pirellulimonas nuda TaxID=2528009 RepID=A0A518DEF3_9BACT|nr:ABC transporter substrate-binding protein [Pirellulimonas nuda]QDU89847.1 hypothetical protein Pla175_32430 [Pirellulimonas nuda]
MFYVGLDDTDMPDTPGTNQLARHVVQRLAGRWRGRLITRHQLLEDPRVPCTRKNGCVAVSFDPLDAADALAGGDELLAGAIAELMAPWCPVGSDPGLCVCVGEPPAPVVAFGLECKRELVDQPRARGLAAQHGILLRGLGGTQDGVIGALAAIGLAASRDDGRVIYNGAAERDHFDVSGDHAVATLGVFGVDEVRRLDNQRGVDDGVVALGKRLRPNYRAGKIVLYVLPSQQEGIDWDAQRVL